MQNFLAFFILILLGFIWGSGYTLAKYAMTHSVPPLGYSFWQSIGPALLLSLVCLAKYGINWLKPRYWLFFLVCGLVGIVIPNTNMFFIANHLPAGLLAVLVNTVPLLVYPLALLFNQERFDFGRFFALLLGITGLLLIMAPAGISHLSFWALLALISPLGFAACTIYIAGYQPRSLNALQAACGMLIASSLLLMPLIIKKHSFYPITLPLNRAEFVVLLEIILSSIGYLLFFYLIRLAGAVYYSLTGGVVALTGLFWGYVFFQEKPGFIQAAASCCVITAIFLLSWRQQNLPLEQNYVK